MRFWCYGVLTSVLALVPLSGVQAAEAIGQIKTVAGEAYILRATSQTPAAAGDLLEAADTLITGPAGRIGITFIDNSRFSVGPNSQIALEKFTFNPTTQEGEFHANIKRGTLGVISGNIAHTSPEAMKVKTRTSVLGVRGTHFLVKVDE